jgi:hypothetical protein
VAAAANRIDKLLAQDPFGSGRSLSEGLYLIRIQPVTMWYTINAVARHVEITWVWSST